jgi:glucose-1-phosphate thymidylyltransferase
MPVERSQPSPLPRVTAEGGRLPAVKGLILSGGAGTRLRPITHTSAKQLVPVANKPILFYGIEDMVEAGITDIGIVTGETGPEIRAAVGDGSRFGARVTYLPQDAPLGLAHCVLIARDFLGDDDFVMYLGDNLLRQGIAEFVDRFEADRSAAAEPRLGEDAQAPSAQILLARVHDPQRFGVAAFDDRGNVVQLVEKPDEPPSDLALVGVYLFDRSIHDAVAAIEPSPRGELEITDAIQWLIDHGHRVRHEELDGWWKDTGKLEPLLEGNRLILETLEPATHGTVDAISRIEGRVVIEAGAQVINSRILGPAIIGERTRIVDSYIGPFTSISADCAIVDTEIEHSVVLEHSRIEGIGGVSDSLIGKEVEVVRCASKPSATRLMLGDHSRVEIE